MGGVEDGGEGGIYIIDLDDLVYTMTWYPALSRDLSSQCVIAMPLGSCLGCCDEVSKGLQRFTSLVIDSHWSAAILSIGSSTNAGK